MTYYFPPQTIKNLDGRSCTVNVHMHCHVYHEGVGKKSADNVALLIIKTLKTVNVMHEYECGKK